MTRVHGRTLRITLLAICLITPAVMAEGPAGKTLEQQLTAELGRLQGKTQAALVVEKLGGGRMFAANPDLPLKPASVLKLFTTATALLRLGSDFQFETRFALDGNDLLVIGSGDPGLGDERICRHRGDKVTAVFDRLATTLRSRGVTTIQTIALDDGIFDQEFRHPEWPNDQQDEWYQAPVGGLNFNDNCLDTVAKLVQGKPVLVPTPALPVTFFRNELQTSGKRAPGVMRRADSDVFTYTGRIEKTTAFEPVAVRDPTVFFGHALKAELGNRGIEVRGDVVRRQLSLSQQAAAQIVHREQTALSSVLWRANTFSQNLFSEALLKAIAAYGPNGERSGHAGSWTRGAFVLRKVLSDAGVDLDGAAIRDGSGLSHENRVSAAQIVRLLQVMHARREGPAFRESLARPRQPGTMQRGYTDASLQNRVWAKTGTIANVRTLAGYVRRPDGTELAFALLMNGPSGSDLRAKVAKILVEAPVR